VEARARGHCAVGPGPDSAESDARLGLLSESAALVTAPGPGAGPGVMPTAAAVAPGQGLRVAGNSPVGPGDRAPGFHSLPVSIMTQISPSGLVTTEQSSY
jgi:hypothetical protein